MALAAGYWARGGGVQRPTGTWAMVAMFAAFAGSFASYAPLVSDAIESVVPHAARLLSNSFTMAGATAILIFTFQLNVEAEEARPRIRVRLMLLAGVVLTMTLLFGVERLTGDSAYVYALYVLVYISSLLLSLVDFLGQTWSQSRSAQRQSLRIGLRVASVGCLLALIYVAYKVAVPVSIGLGVPITSDQHREPCSSVLVWPCGFSVATPALAVLLITVGLTLPRITSPISQALHRRWEARSYAKLGPLWEDLSSAVPEIILWPEDPVGNTSRKDVGLLLHRRVIEIYDAVLTLRPYRSKAVYDIAHHALATSGAAATAHGQAKVEASVLRAAVRAKRSGCDPHPEVAPPALGMPSGDGDLRAETQWLLALAGAYSSEEVIRLASTESSLTAGVSTS
ncbi:MAB_1171c family putative transporter [Streptomyces sp. B6B3]|uniref:MAB_1171c family putative transporter n=1 Tax=Streptomyces sp. B6B3 TaxID=3153570 RepID=UPI00325CB937